MMNSIVNHMGKYDHRQHVLSDWLAKLEQRFQLGEVKTDKAKITWCQLLIGTTGSSILAGLEDDASWEIAKETLLSRLGVGSVRDEAWAALKQLKRGSKEIVELAGEAEKLATCLHPCDEEAAERHAIDTFFGAINRSLEMPLPEVATPVPPIAETSPAATLPTALPGEPLSTNPATASLSVALPSAAPHTLLLETADIRPETARLVRCHNPWPAEDVLFYLNDALPAFVTGIPALSSGPELWIAIHNHRPEPLQLHSVQNIGVLEVVTLADTPPTASQPGPPLRPPLPERLSPLQQQQLNDLFREFSDVFSQGEDDLGSAPLLEHTIETHGPPLRQPYRRQNPAVRREEMAQVQQMLASDVICPSNSPWASPVVMVKKKDGSLCFCVDFQQLNAATIKDAHPLPRIDDLLDALHGARWFSTLENQSRSVIKQRSSFIPAVDSCTNLIRSHSVFATLLPPSLASWIASSPASTGRRTCSI